MVVPQGDGQDIGVTILGGYLGSGKTTRVNDLLANALTVPGSRWS